MFLNEDLSEYQKTKTSENFNPKITKIHQKFSNDICDPDDINDFCRFTDMININTFGSQPIIMYRKAKKLYSPKEEKRVDKKIVAKSQEKILINNYIKTNFIVDGGLPQKLNKYKSNMINVHSQSPINKNKKKFKAKTNRNTGNTKIRLDALLAIDPIILPLVFLLLIHSISSKSLISLMISIMSLTTVS